MERALAIAATAHEGQLDKAGAPYILHPLRVMLSLEKNEERIVAVLHDVLEDTAVSIDDLRKEGFSEEILDALASVTKCAGESYEAFLRRAAENTIGRRVKLADLKDNSNLSRISDPGSKDLDRMEKYRRATAFLNGHDNGKTRSHNAQD